jgi:hypothetical protein
MKYNYPKKTNYKYALRKSFYQHVLSFAVNNNIGLINLTNQNIAYEFISDHPLEISDSSLLCNLVLNYYGEKALAKNIPIPHDFGNQLETTDDFIRNEEYASYMAIHQYLVNQTNMYIEDVNKFEDMYASFNEKYLNNNRIKFLSNDIVSNDDFEMENPYEPKIIKSIEKLILNSHEINSFSIFNVATFRYYDLFENYGLGQFEGGYDSYDDPPSNHDIQSRWAKYEKIWDSKFIEAIKYLSKKTSKCFYIKISYDYPVVNKLNFHLV